MATAPDPMQLHPVPGQERVGYSALVLPGVNIGSGAVVAAGSVVAADVPPYAIMAGEPAELERIGESAP